MHWGQPLARVEDSGGYPLPAWPAPGWCRRMAGLLLALVDAGLARWTARDGRRWSQQAYYGMQRRLSMWVQDRRQREGFAPSCGRPATLLMATGKLNITVCFLSSVWFLHTVKSLCFLLGHGKVLFAMPASSGAAAGNSSLGI